MVGWRRNFYRCFTLLIFNLFTTAMCADSFTSLVHLHRAIDAESDIVPYINSYVQAERDRLNRIERLTQEFLNHHAELSGGDSERHLSNPVNAFILIKKMSELYLQLYTFIETDSKSNVDAYNTESENTRSYLPPKDDLDGAVLALLRLQDTYSLETSQLTDSNLGLGSAEHEAPPLTGDDCYLIAKTAFLNNDFYHSVMWFQATLAKYDSVGEDLQTDHLRSQIASSLDYLNFALFKQGNLELAISAAVRLTELQPGADPATDNIVHYHEELEGAGLTYNPDSLPPLKNERLRQGFADTTEFKNYETLCRGGKVNELTKGARQLVCRYRPKLYSYYPSLEEELNLNPRLVYIHRIISDSEVEVVKRLAKPKLSRSGVFATNKDTPAGGIKTHTRVSKSAWIYDTEDEVIASLSVRFSRVTGLTIDHAESLQVLNYGIGGHYEPHCDFARADNPNVFEQGAGNRIATLILYLTDVEKGGATVFPRLGAAVWPEKGGAAFWHNLLEDGGLDDRTLHGACPVLVGYKWVCNKWFHEGGNEFTRPCQLQPSDRE